jgi:hypothetical protein
VITAQSLETWRMHTIAVLEAERNAPPPLEQVYDELPPPPEPTPFDELPEVPPDDWEAWLRLIFPRYVRYPFSDFHREFWEWAWGVQLGVYREPFIAAWFRGAAKSTSAELGTAAWAARGSRRYGLYVHATQEKADDHVSNIGRLLENPVYGHYYPDAANRAVSKFGSYLAWRRNRLWTRSGFVIDALGLDTAVRGIKLDNVRPDFVIFDDVDELLDSTETVNKKIALITQSILPAATDDAVVLGAQNLIHLDSIFSRLARTAPTEADFLVDRHVSGPVPAVENMSHEYVPGKGETITGGRATWAGYSLEACQRFVNREGMTSFLIECQHELDVGTQGVFKDVVFEHCDWDQVPELVRAVVMVDPAVSDTKNADSHGIQASGMGVDEKVYALYSWEARTSPEDSLTRATLKAIELGADTLGVETDQGGDTWATVYAKVWRDLVEEPPGEVCPGCGFLVVNRLELTAGRQCLICDPSRRAISQPTYTWEKAGAGFGPKTHRAQQMLTDYERAKIVHVRGTHMTLERALRRFPIRKPYDLVDAAFWSWWFLTKTPPPAGLSDDRPLARSHRPVARPRYSLFGRNR